MNQAYRDGSCGLISDDNLMYLQKALLAILVTCLLSACSLGNALWHAEQSCVKFPTPDARAECERKARADQAAFARETQKAKDQERARVEADRQTSQPPTTETTSPLRQQNNLCFKRAGSDEWVCPN